MRNRLRPICDLSRHVSRDIELHSPSRPALFRRHPCCPSSGKPDFHPNQNFVLQRRRDQSAFSNAVSNLCNRSKPVDGLPRAARARKRNSISNSVTARLASSSTSLFMLILRCAASVFKRSCWSDGRRIVRTLMDSFSSLKKRRVLEYVYPGIGVRLGESRAHLRL